MDWPAAIAIAVPLSTLIVTIGTYVMKTKNGASKNNNSRSRGLVTHIELGKKLENVVYVDTCKEVQKRFDAGFDAIKETMKNGFEDLKEDIKALKR